GRRAGCDPPAQRQRVQRQPRLWRIGRHRAYAKHARRAVGLQRALTVAEQTVEEATGALSAEARARDGQGAAALGHQQETTFHHGVALAVDVAAVAQVFADALHGRALGRGLVELAIDQRN